MPTNLKYFIIKFKEKLNRNKMTGIDLFVFSIYNYSDPIFKRIVLNKFNDVYNYFLIYKIEFTISQFCSSISYTNRKKYGYKNLKRDAIKFLDFKLKDNEITDKKTNKNEIKYLFIYFNIF